MRKDPLELSESARDEYYEETLEAFKAYGILPDVPLGSPPKMKLCIDCKWHKMEVLDIDFPGHLLYLPWEKRPWAQEEVCWCLRKTINPVDGFEFSLHRVCRQERETGCGPDGKYWEAK